MTVDVTESDTRFARPSLAGGSRSRLACAQWPGCANDRGARNAARSPTASTPIACSCGWRRSILTPSETVPVCCASATPIRWSCRSAGRSTTHASPSRRCSRRRGRRAQASTTPAAGDVRWTQPASPAADELPLQTDAGSHGRRAEWCRAGRSRRHRGDAVDARVRRPRRSRRVAARRLAAARPRVPGFGAAALTTAR